MITITETRCLAVIVDGRTADLAGHIAIRKFAQALADFADCRVTLTVAPPTDFHAELRHVADPDPEAAA